MIALGRRLRIALLVSICVVALGASASHANPGSFNYNEGTAPWVTAFGQPGGGSTIHTLTADVTGDGRSDAIAVVNGTWYVANSSGTSFNFQMTPWITSFGVPSPSLTINTHAEDVNGDGKADAVAVVNGNWYVALSTGTSFSPYSPVPWVSAFGQPGVGLSIKTHLADMNGDGKADAVAVVNGSWYVAPSTGSSFSFSPQTPWITSFGTPNPAVSISTIVADTNGDGKSDGIAVVNGTWYVALSTGTGFLSHSTWKTGFGVPNPNASIQTLTGDVTGDAKADAIAVVNGSWYVAPSTGSGFGAHSTDPWASGLRSPSGNSVQPFAAKATGGSRADAIAVENGNWYVAPTTGDTDTPQPSYANWTRIFYDDFSVPSTGTNWDPPCAGSDSVAYTGLNGSQWSVYSSCRKDTDGRFYNPKKVLSVSGGNLTFSLGTDAGTTPPAGASPSPIINTTINPRYQRYGRYSARMKVDPETSGMRDYKIAWLLWPREDNDWKCMETDFPETNLDEFDNVQSNPHRCGINHNDQVDTPTTLTAWHTFTQEWNPIGRFFYIDGKLVDSSTNPVEPDSNVTPNNPDPNLNTNVPYTERRLMRWQLQTETYGSLDRNDSGEILVDWVTVHDYVGAGS